MCEIVKQAFCSENENFDSELYFSCVHMANYITWLLRCFYFGIYACLLAVSYFLGAIIVVMSMEYLLMVCKNFFTFYLIWLVESLFSSLLRMVFNPYIRHAFYLFSNEYFFFFQRKWQGFSISY